MFDAMSRNRSEKLVANPHDSVEHYTVLESITLRLRGDTASTSKALAKVQCA